jgi:hypothetical protein
MAWVSWLFRDRLQLRSRPQLPAHDCLQGSVEERIMEVVKARQNSAGGGAASMSNVRTQVSWPLGPTTWYRGTGHGLPEPSS